MEMIMKNFGNYINKNNQLNWFSSMFNLPVLEYMRYYLNITEMEKLILKY